MDKELLKALEEKRKELELAENYNRNSKIVINSFISIMKVGYMDELMSILKENKKL